jgi:hypothetical protein
LISKGISVGLAKAPYLPKPIAPIKPTTITYGEGFNVKIKSNYANSMGFDKKSNQMQEVAKQEKLVKTKPSKRDRKIISDYKDRLNEKIDKQWLEKNPNFVQKAKYTSRT